MRFTLAQLDAFDRIVETGSFHAAARQLHLTQPTVSQRIRELESGIGQTLFVRNGPSFRLTAEGTAFLVHARQVLASAAALEGHIKGAHDIQGVLRLGVTDSFALICLNDLLRTLDQKYPELKTSVQVVDGGTAAHMLEAHVLDLAIVSEPQLSPAIRQRPLGQHELAWMAGGTARLPKLTRPSDLASLHIMLSPAPSRLHETVMAWFAADHAVPTRLSTCNSLVITRQTVASGLAIGVLPVRASRDELLSGLIRRLPVDPPLPMHRVSLCYQSTVLGPGLEEIVDLLEALIARHALYV